MKQCTRRNFVKSTALGAGSVMVTGVPVFAAPKKHAIIFKPRMAVNPDINNLRVVCGVNKAMISGDPAGWDMAEQNKPVNDAEVVRTMDAIAVSLSKKSTPDQAWQTIFRKPDKKTWDSVKVAIKVNCIGKNHPRIAVVNKVCTELNKRGVPYSNIVIYDGRHDADSLYTPFVGQSLPEGVIVSKKHDALGGTMKTVILQKDDFREYKCTRMIADGSIDILVNIAVNKSHDQKLGGTTLSLKNHAGTFDPLPIHAGGGFDYILGFSKSDAFWGGNPVRQQLCIIDSLWASVKGGPFNAPDKRLDCIVMGTFSGAVDYYTAKKIREPLMGAVHGPVERFITDFGFNESEMTGWEMITL